MTDLTLLFITAGEVPKTWAEFHMKQLEGFEMITLRDKEKTGYETIYRRMLEGAKQATTPYVAMVEDDVLYSRDHFSFRPPLDTFAYNQNRWALFTWGPAVYSWRNRKSNCSLIAPRELLIEALEERFAAHPDGIPVEFCGELGRERIEKALGVTPRKSVEYFSATPIVQLNHDNGTEPLQAKHKKTLGPLQAYDIPRWGKAESIRNLYV